ncbi:MAG: molybdopterin-guanine dinucleotide biosynthesis protein B [Gammaproteobacteria bacterium]|jgi:molybdopterin-guanine dinucleotide biosynthesis protein MobB
MKTLRYRGVPVIGFAGYSGSGKTTLISRLIPILRRNGLQSAVVKHAHHDFDIDTPGKDSYEIRKAGAAQIIVGSAHRWALITETDDAPEADLLTFLAQLNLSGTDVILVEGFRDIAFPKIELVRVAEARDAFYLRDDYVVAVASDDPLPAAGAIPSFALHDTQGLADFIIGYCQQAVAAQQG